LGREKNDQRDQKEDFTEFLGKGDNLNEPRPLGEGLSIRNRCGSRVIHWVIFMPMWKEHAPRAVFES
jgi:hypothetical protein